MTFLTLAARNVTRNKLRVTLTILGAAVSVLAFLLLRTILWSWHVRADVSAKDRLGTRHKVSFTMQLPKKYAQDVVDHIPEVKAITYFNWFGAKYPKDETLQFASLAVDYHTFLDVYPEVVISPEAKARWLSDPQAALIGELTARKIGVKEGDNITLRGTIYPGDWEFHVAGIYTASSKALDRSAFYFHWDYLNDSPHIPDVMKNQVGWMAMRISDPAHSADVSAKIDRMFDEQDPQTITMSENALQNSFLGMFSSVLDALDVVSYVILLIMAMILGNTLAMGVRERTNEYGVLKAIGFEPPHIVTFILGEAIFTGLLGGLVGLAIAVPLFGFAAKVIADGQLAQLLPNFGLQTSVAVIAVALATGLGAVASLIPAVRAARIPVTDALRRVG